MIEIKKICWYNKVHSLRKKEFILIINKTVKEIIEWCICIIVAVALGLGIKYYIGTPTLVQHTSMYPTLKSGERLLLNRLYRTFQNAPQRGEIITFEAPISKAESKENPVAIYDNSQKGFFENFIYYTLEIGKTSYIKRVIGLPGEYVEIKDGKVFINGELLIEDYLTEGLYTNEGGEYTDIIVPQDCIFVMGDNRSASMDSRSFGCVPISKIEGKVLLRFWPIDRWGSVE